MNKQQTLRSFFCLLLMIGSTGAAAAPWKDHTGGPSKGDKSAELAFSADMDTYLVGQAATLRWSSINTKFCSASGDWSGKLSTEGSYRTAALDGPKSYTLKCTAAGGGITETLDLQVTEPDPLPEAGAEAPAVEAPAPTLTFTAQEGTIASGTTATLTWTAENVTSCTASGGWAGSKLPNGSEALGPLYGSTAFTLSCDGSGSNVVETVRVDVIGQVTLNWQAPEQNVDGSPLTDLAGFTVYYGTASRDYTSSVRVGDPAAASHTLSLTSGTYHVAMTALDVEGNESALSNEVLRTVP